MMSQPNGFSLVLGEDDQEDVRIMKRVLKSVNHHGAFTHLSIGQDVLDWTLKRNQYTDAAHPTPQLIILDIGLPGVSGVEVLKTLRQEEATKHIPIIMCSGSASQRDYHNCIALGCNAYIQKNTDLEIFTKTCQLFIEGWWYLLHQKFY